MKRLSKESPIPLYYQLKEILQEMIEDEVLRPGDSIPSERELCEMHGISRMTVRKAVIDLVNKGLAYREQGKGTFVAAPKKKHQLMRLKGFTEEMEEKGLKTSTKMLFFEVNDATKEIRVNLNMLERKNSRVIKMSRLRIVEEKPFAIETAWIPFDMCQDMTRQMVEESSFYKIVKEKYGYVLDYARQTSEPVKMNDYESSLLGLEEGSLALLFRRTTYLKSGEVIEYVKSIYRGDMYKYEAILRA